ncbi:hypothetical protein OOK36_34120 [Streptomyces sp. NBC_00365]|uniref:hypothetical protein n=1 Tax=Streptomyces sp. NBC_00365 TaxID=2975726 RepID=UPI0022515704|nr:hypothetical protein [Streptomyces sp. NBC_00365]MCX5093836.1 hypothetical protein [Streptomyces sp. NBC_00365]
MDLIIDPPRAAGPVEIGMPIGAAEQALRSISGFLPPTPGERRAPGFAHYTSEMSIAVDATQDGRVRSIEIYRPTEGVDIRLGEISIFGVPADEVILRLGEMASLQVEDEGLRVVAPSLLISLWRGTLPESPEDEDGRYFESVLIAEPGYYD